MNFTVCGEVQNADSGNSENPETADFSDAQNGHSSPQRSPFETSAALKPGALDRPKAEGNKTEYNKIYPNETDSIYPIHLEHSLKQTMDAMDGYQALLKEKWGYAALVDTLGTAKLDGVITLGADVLCSNSPTIRIGKQDLPREMVVQRLLSLDFTHIQYVFECLEKTQTPIRNMRAYLLTALYYAPTTIDAQVDHQVALDMAKESRPPM
jgi:hypothetical protein